MGFKRLFKNPFIFGAAIGIFVIIFNISIASLGESSLKGGYSVFLGNGLFIYLIPLSVGVQMGLFRHHRNITAGKKLCGSEKAGVAGSAVSSVTMVACCLHHVGDLLPAAGLILATSSFITRYKDAIIIFGLIANAAGSAYIAREILKDGKVSAKENCSIRVD